MTKKLQDLRWKPMWVSHLGCIKGCLQYLDIECSDAWLFGSTGHAFIINIGEGVCPSGPTAWKTEMLFKLGRNLGYNTDGVFSRKSQHDFALKQRAAWDHTKRAIDNGNPCYGWELEYPDFYVVNGYDDVGYYYSGPLSDEGKGPRPWQELGDTAIGVIEMYSVEPGEASNDTKTVKDALCFALEHSTSPGKWISANYRAGISGYDAWINAVRTDIADSGGMAYNATVWSECRTHAVGFLEEAQDRLSNYASLFDEAIEHYKIVAENLDLLASCSPSKVPIAMD